MKEAINQMCEQIHSENARWWKDLTTGEDLSSNPFFMPAKMMLVCSEIAEAVEGHRKNLMDDKLPHRKSVEVELADAVIRIFDLAAGHKMDLGGAIVEKLEYNRARLDHTDAHRKGEGGKSY